MNGFVWSLVAGLALGGSACDKAGGARQPASGARKTAGGFSVDLLLPENETSRCESC